MRYKLTEDNTAEIIEEEFVRDCRLAKPLAEEMDNLLHQVKYEKNDVVIVIDGKEGMGKTRTALTIGAYCAEKLGTSFGVENVHYGTQEYMESCKKLGKNSVHILDEAGVILHRSAANTKDSKRFNRFLQVCREGYHQVHILVLPAFHVMDGYVINWRCKYVLHMYGESLEDANSPTGKKLQRGAFKVFTASHALTEMWNLYQDRKVFKYPTAFYIHDRMRKTEPFSSEEIDALYKKKNAWREEFIGKEDKEEKEDKKSKASLKKETVQYFIDAVGFVPTPENLVKAFKVSKSYSYELSREFMATGGV